MLWSRPDPSYQGGWTDGEGREVSFVYGREVIEKFLAKHNLKKLIRCGLVEV